ncbi:uncharacterized protein FTOL_12440 [Fusarium torulosum]|uniref:Uncharacterized protein n=1 Tax=Fusarium torulosum TaxID=33205 RepID=A0AAE8MLN7_9HYPO|nr:uncharacterized protein FTOL_12440 [Fusarium torulosum]
MLASVYFIVMIALLVVLLLLILSATLFVRYFQQQTLGDVESGSIASNSGRLVHTASNSSCTLETLAQSNIGDAFSPTGSASPRTPGTSAQTTFDVVDQPESTPPSQTPGTSAQTIFAVIDRPESTPPSQTSGTSARTTAFAALIPPELCQFANRQFCLGKSSPKQLVHVNPVLRFRLEGQECEINMDNENTSVNFWPRELDSGKPDELSMQELVPVARVFCHHRIDKSIKLTLSRKGIVVTILESDVWTREMLSSL